MKRYLHYFLLLAATAGISLHAQAQFKLTKNNVKKVVATITLSEKAHSVAGVDTCFYPPITAVNRDSSKNTLVKKVNKVLVPQRSIDKAKPTVANSTESIEELNSFAIGM